MIWKGTKQANLMLRCCIMLCCFVFASCANPPDALRFDADEESAEFDHEAERDLDSEADGGESPYELDLADSIFVPDLAIPGPGQVSLVLAGFEEDYLILDVRIGAVEQLLRINFRLLYDPSVLALAAVDNGNAMAKNAEIRTTLQNGGAALVGLNNVDGATVDIVNMKRLCRLSFTILSNESSRIDFDPDPKYTSAVDGNQAPIHLTYFGGLFGPPSSE